MKNKMTKQEKLQVITDNIRYKFPRLVDKEPMLTDVLAWLSLLKEVCLCYLDHHSFLVIEKPGKFYYQVIDITKPYLKDQPNEVIKFLYKFTKNETT
ncbi:hypothetical protein OKE68_02185 [Riemerella anatipestifer]|uniref:Uncharacterized protein n=1 Tax=Riemerella anatipestifer TaxID=34085 RepID=A0AAP3AJP9_RIEAN|nr:hypothetical protein [Riemerella anatipestifer]MBT0572800.1 hypothetical protein [Riemerella anatipestifer]MCE3025306.1 hypothetical protein [Riemerella anatipestifer]MCU7560911.1 hypothetical protein [Riemerella anatipestifer]MCU7567819.1 hypothetical protein [Riemerella anatipestifer]MCW0489311.1 hypothetical protein [Riemerella anatipestifer]